MASDTQDYVATSPFVHRRRESAAEGASAAIRPGRLDEAAAAVHVKDVAGDEGGAIGGEERHGIGDLGRGPETARRNEADQVSRA